MKKRKNKSKDASLCVPYVGLFRQEREFIHLESGNGSNLHINHHNIRYYGGREGGKMERFFCSSVLLRLAVRCGAKVIEVGLPFVFLSTIFFYSYTLPWLCGPQSGTFFFFLLFFLSDRTTRCAPVYAHGKKNYVFRFFFLLKKFSYFLL